ncbi:MAG: YifB family Mg chelatase-like AAA ATPase [Myxococcales bacterium]|nr:YifB family Mg chelatase-like AAA ATPase [Myxococcales bacterium]MCB9733991.1 YifB family Mg chelatase-like AAA ATPase [Deltaproteobacteria bacterium]
MAGVVRGVGILGIDGVLVDVQVGHQDGLPGMDITGLPATSLREARHRVRSALRACGYGWPKERVHANLAPASFPKAGTAFDLPLAVATLVLMGAIPEAAVADALFYGELGLDGGVRPVAGAINAALAASEGAVRRVFVAAESAGEAALVPGLEVFAVDTLVGLVEGLRGERDLVRGVAALEGRVGSAILDLSLLRGQARGRRALEVAAAGGHNLLFVGPPGCGKTLLARALPGILPRLAFADALEVTRIASAAGLTAEGALCDVRPFRAPHATSSYAALIGGGNPPRPGEVSLAHHGVLFLDELPEFGRSALESLRAPLEDREVRVSRCGRSVLFPASFSLVAAMNPCPCGHLGDSQRECRCTASRVEAYRQRVSGPLLDRLDIHVELGAIPPEDLARYEPGEPSSVVRARVAEARRRQVERNRVAGRSVANAELDVAGVEQFARLAAPESVYLARVGRRLGLSARAWHRVIRVARTIADLAGADDIDRAHLAEALTYRRVDLGGRRAEQPTTTWAEGSARS